MSDPTTKELEIYHGNCHCGAFKFSVKLPELKNITECNCGICFKKGYKWVFPGEDCFTVERGEGILKEYEFGQKATVHKFCPTCGTSVLQQRKGFPPHMTFAVNARTLMEIDLWSLEVVPYDGTGREPVYIAPPFTGTEPTANVQNPRLYTGACHCGAVTVAMKTKGPLPQGGEYIQECDCSICARNGTTLIYPHPTQVSFTNEQSLTGYKFGASTQNHKFCSTCGTSVYIERIPLTPAEFKKWHSSNYDRWMEQQGVNLRLFEGVEWKDIDVKRAFWSRSEPKYVCPE